MKQYHDLMQHVLDNGIDSEDRTGVGTKSVFGYQMRFDLNKGFPLVTTKKVNFDMVTSELLFFLEGSTDERRLAEIRYGKPREQLIGKKTIWTANADNQGKAKGYINNDMIKGLGNIYGHQWRDWDGIDQIQNAIDMVNTTPYSRKIVVSAWNVADLEHMALSPCHAMFNLYVRDNKLSCHLNQVSGDVFLGIPFNIASYALLTHMIAMVCNLEVGEFIHTIGDAHIYNNHIDQCKEQLTRKEFDLPRLILHERDNIDGFTMDDFELVGYQSHPAIKGEMAV